MKVIRFGNSRRAMPAIVFAMLIALPGLVLGHPAISSARPNDGSSVAEWDIEKYDACMATNPMGPGSNRYCCDRSGGVIDYKTAKCVAPSAASIGQQPQVPGTIPSDDGIVFWPGVVQPPADPVAPPPGEATLAPN